MKKFAFATGIAFIFLASGSFATHAQEADARPDTEIVAEQYLLLGTATRGCGESQLAINPLNPAIMAVSAMCQINQEDGKFQHDELQFERTPRATITEFAITRDRGLTWTITEDPMRAYFHRYRCLDPFAAFTPDGTMILGCEAHFPTTLSPQEEVNEAVRHAEQDYGGSAMIWSTDGGRSFSEPVQIISSYMPKELFGPFVSFAPVGSQGDRPQIRVDISTGKIYVNGNSAAAEPPHYQTVVRMSKDRGRDWGMVYAFDSAEWPGSGAAFDVARGMMGIAYVATAVPASLNFKCPCWVFGTSTDDGKTFERHLIQGAPAPTGGGRGGGGGVIVVANPAKRGMFLVWVPTSNGANSYVTDDSGKTWTKGVSLPEVPSTTVANLTASSSANGVVALAWRVVERSGTAQAGRGGGGRGGLAPSQQTHVFYDMPDRFDIYSAISRDGGKTFSVPFKVSRAQSPGPSRRRSMSNHGNDFISVALDNDFVHMTWFDDRTGFRGTWYGRVPLVEFR